MALLVELSGEQLELAREEAVSAASTLSSGPVRIVEVDGPVLVLDAPGVTGRALAGRLGLAHHVSDGAISGPPGTAADLATSVDLGAASSFRVRARRTEIARQYVSPKDLEAEAGSAIGARSGARVDLGTPEAEVRVILAGMAHAGLLGGSVDRGGMEARAVRHRPFSHPVSIHPKFARAMVNLSRAGPGDVVLDPFCGTGGVVIEAVLLGHRALGSDIDPRMVEGSRENLAALGLEAGVRLADVGDAGPADGSRVDAIVTDPPYGRSTSLHGDLSDDVLSRLYTMARALLEPGHRLVVCLPDPAMLPREGEGFHVLSVHPMKVHRSLTRHVCVLVR